MAKEIQADYAHGATLYFLVWNATGSIWRTDTLVFEAPNSANWSHYAISMTEEASLQGRYDGTMPAAPAGIYSIDVVLQAGGSPASSDYPGNIVATGRIEWSGTVEIPRATLANALPSAAPNTSGGLATIGTGAGQINPDGTGAIPVAFGTALPSNPTSNTVGEALYYPSQRFGRRNTAQAGSTATITLDGGASSNDNAYRQHLIKIASGTGAGQFRTIVGYVGSTKVATVDPAWTTAPDNTSVFWIEPYPEVNVGLWAGGPLPANFGSLSIDTSGRVTLAPAGLDTVVVETGLNARQALALVLAAEAGDTAGAGATGTTFAIAAAGSPSTQRIAATTDFYGNRTVNTLSPPS
jgi:hypothetical protein